MFCKQNPKNNLFICRLNLVGWYVTLTEKWALVLFLQDCYAVVCGAAEETKALLQNRFDHIFYTGEESDHYITAENSLRPLSM